MSLLPEVTYVSMKNSWLEFEKEQSPEARYARVIDALVPLINHLEVSEVDYNPRSYPFRDGIRKEKVHKK